MQSFQYGLLAVWLVSLVGLIMIIVAVNTDRWVIYDVVESGDIRLRYRKFPYAYDRSMGLFRECFVGIYQPLVEFDMEQKIFGKRCLNTIGRWLYPRDEIADITQIRVHSQVIWSQLITGGLGILALLVAMTTSFAAWCVKFPPCLLLTTGTALLIAFVLLCTSMGLWHTADYIRKDSIQLDGYYSNWPEIIRDNTEIHFDWSYMIMWAGIICVLISTLLQLICYCMAKSDSEDRRNRRYVERHERAIKKYKQKKDQKQTSHSPVNHVPAADGGKNNLSYHDTNGKHDMKGAHYASVNGYGTYNPYYMCTPSNGYGPAATTTRGYSNGGNAYMVSSLPENAYTHDRTGGGYAAHYGYGNYAYSGDDKSTLMGVAPTEQSKVDTKHKGKHRKVANEVTQEKSGASGSGAMRNVSNVKGIR